MTPVGRSRAGGLHPPGRHGHHNKVGAGETARVGGAFEMAGRTQVFPDDFAGGIAVILVGGDLGFGQVVADGLEFFAKFNGKWQANVTQAYDRNDDVFVNSHVHHTLK